jgi:hypothetical protein
MGLLDGGAIMLCEAAAAAAAAVLFPRLEFGLLWMRE